MVSGLEASTRLDATRSAAVVAGFLGVLTLSVLDLVPLFKGLAGDVGGAALLPRILTLDEIRRRFPLDIWLVVGGALAIADQLEKSGLAKNHRRLADGEFNGASPIIAFIGIYLFTLVLTELMSNNAAAALAFPWVTSWRSAWMSPPCRSFWRCCSGRAPALSCPTATRPT